MNILAVSFAYPPLAYPRSIQVARLLKNTEASTALFCAHEPAARRDDTIEPNASSFLTTCGRIEVKSTASSRLINRLSYRFRRPIWNTRNLAPDAYGHWGSDVIKGVREYLKTGAFQPDIIVTFAQPFTDHLIGLELKKELGLPWLAHFSDPWVDNPFGSSDEEIQSLNLALERSVAETADMLAFTSQETVDLFFAKYPKELARKAAVLPQCFDSGRYAEVRPEGKITLRYLGNFYGSRTPRPLVQALKEIEKEGNGILEDVQFELVGSGHADDVKRLAEGLPEGLLTVRASVDYATSLSLMSSADALIVIDAPAAHSVFLPSKLVDYIGANRPVFGITPPGTACKLILELGGRVADPADPAAITNELMALLTELRERRSSRSLKWGQTEVRDRFTTDAVSRDFLRMLNELTA
jgi:hypothetical protein